MTIPIEPKYKPGSKHDLAGWVLMRLDALATRMQHAIDNADPGGLQRIKDARVRRRANSCIKTNSKRANAVLECPSYLQVPMHLQRNLDKAIAGVDRMEKILETIETLAYQQELF